MAHFFKPTDAAASEYTVDEKICPGSVSQMKVPVFGMRQIVLYDGTPGNALSVTSKNTSVIPNDGFREFQIGANRYLTFYGASTGKSTIEVSQGKNFWISIEVAVTSEAKQEGKWVRVNRHGMSPKGQATSTLCWLTCFEMLFQWKGRDSSEIEPALRKAGIDVDTARLHGLLPKDNDAAAQALGLDYLVSGGSLSSQQLQHYLYSSPLWIAGMFFPGGLHVRVVTGASQEFVEFIDPWYGGTAGYDLEHKDTIDNFVHGTKNAPGTDTPRCRGYAQLLYWGLR